MPREHLNRDTRLQILTLRSIAKFTHAKIAETLNVSVNQVRWAIKAGHPTPSKRKGRPKIITSEHVDEIEAFVCSSREIRQMPY